MGTAGRLLGWIGRAAGILLLVLVVVLLLFRLIAAMREDETGRPRSTTMIATPLGQVAAELKGPLDGPPIILVHGTAGWSGFWRDVSRHLAARGWRVIAVDLPPFGYSDHDPAARYDRASQALRLAFVLRAQARAPAIVVAHSFGAGPATELALRYPGPVKRLVLVDAALGTLDPPADTHSPSEQAMRIGIVAEPVTAAVLTNPMMTGQLVRSMIARKEAAGPWLATLQQPMRRKGTTAAYADWLPTLFAKDDGGLSRDSSRLRSIRPSVALIWGADDTVTPLAQGDRIAALTQADSFIRLPGVGHVPHIEDPAGFLRALDASIGTPGGNR